MKWNWKDLLVKSLIRAFRTFLQTFAGSITVGALWTEVQWTHALSVSGVAFVYSLAMSLTAGIPEAEKIPVEIEPPDEDPEDTLPEE